MSRFRARFKDWNLNQPLKFWGMSPWNFLLQRYCKRQNNGIARFCFVVPFLMCFQGPQKWTEIVQLRDCTLPVMIRRWTSVWPKHRTIIGGRKEVERIGKTAGTGSFPIPSMYCIFSYIHHQNQPNVGNYTIHGSYEFYTSINALRSKTK